MPLALSRRELCLLGGGSALLTMPIAAGLPTRTAAYHSTLVNGLTPPAVRWDGRAWKSNMGSTWQPGMGHCLQLSPESARFEIRNSPRDRSRTDEPHKRRSELSGKIAKAPALLPIGVPLWSAMSFIHHRWADPAGMAELTGGVHGQVHMGKGFGGSPALAFRRTADGQFAVTTRGQQAPKGARHYLAPLTFGQAHDLVYRLVLHPLDGSLAVWLDGERIVDVKRASIGSAFGDSHWNIGCYFAGGVTSPVIAEYANVIYPGEASLAGRATRPAPWPGPSAPGHASRLSAAFTNGETRDA